MNYSASRWTCWCKGYIIQNISPQRKNIYVYVYVDIFSGKLKIEDDIKLNVAPTDDMAHKIGAP